MAWFYVERVHPTPLYEFFIWLAIGAILWRLGKGVDRRRAQGRSFLRLPDSDRHSALFDRVYPHQSAIVFRPFECANSKSGVDCRGCHSVLVHQKSFSGPQGGRSRHRACGLAEAILQRAFQLSFHRALKTFLRGASTIRLYINHICL